MKYIFLIPFLVLFLCSGLSQNISTADLSKVRVDELTDAQVKKLIKSAEERGMTDQQLETVALSKGMRLEEIQKLRLRVHELKVRQDKSAIHEQTEREYSFEPKADIFETLARQEKDANEKIKQVFGYSLFNSKELTFEPSINIPTPENYKIGPGDEVIINIWGASQQSYSLTVNSEGRIYINELGPVTVNGLSITKASQRIKYRLTGIYSGMGGSKPNTYCEVSLGNLRSIKVHIVGEAVAPGSYTISSLSTVFNALYYAGGPGLNGSFRKINVIRDNKEIASIDLYDFLLNGKQDLNIRLQDEDVIHIPPYKTRVEVLGEIKRPGRYEMKENETVNDLIYFAGGFTELAFKKTLKLQRSGDSELEVFDLLHQHISEFSLENGDVLNIEPILERYKNRVEIRGAVFREGVFELENALTLKKLIEKAEGLKEDAYLDRASIYRLNDLNETEVIPIDIRGLMENRSDDIALQREDIVKIYSIFDLEGIEHIRISGEVFNTGKYPYFKNISLGDLIASAGGLTDAASLANVEIARRVNNQDSKNTSSQIAEIYQFGISEKLSLDDAASQFILQPNDYVFVRRSPGYEKQQVMTIEGEVIYPGSYAIKNKDERISDIIKRAGGLRDEAFVKGAKLIRRIDKLDKQQHLALESIMSESKDSIELKGLEHTEQAVGINLERILDKPGGKEDLLIEEGDIIKIPKSLQTVRLNGALLYPATVRYDKKSRLRRYISSAGGFSSDAKKSKVYVLYANGSVKRTKSYFWIKDYPKMQPGAEVIVPRKPERDSLTTQEVISIGTGLSTLSLVIVTLVNAL